MNLLVLFERELPPETHVFEHLSQLVLLFERVAGLAV